MRKLTIAAAVFFVLTSACFAQQSSAPPVPKLFEPVLSSYKGWHPDQPAFSDKESSSAFNWALHVRDVLDTQAKFDTFRNWVFTRDENMFGRLAQFFKPQLRDIFSRNYLAWGGHTVFSVSYTADVDGTYGTWYGCMADSKLRNEEDSLTVDEDHVIAYINWHYDEIGGSGNECWDDYMALSRMYGVDALSANEMTGIAFLHRRKVDSDRNPRYVSADMVRETVLGVFEGD